MKRKRKKYDRVEVKTTRENLVFRSFLGPKKIKEIENIKGVLVVPGEVFLFYDFAPIVKLIPREERVRYIG